MGHILDAGVVTIALGEWCSRPGGEGGMVPLKGNLRNLAERSILGC